MRKQFKKIGLSGMVYLVFAVGSASAQIYSENFDGVTAPDLPTGMTERNLDGSTPDTALAALNFGNHGWVTAALTSGGNAAVSYSYKTPQADDWLRTPAITLPGGGTYSLSWKGKADYAPPFNDGYEVLVSTTDTSISSFTDSVFATPGEVAASTFTDHTVDLSAYAGKTIYIAFHNNSANRTYILIDDIVVDGFTNVSKVKPETANAINLFPMPVQNELNVSFHLDQSEAVNLFVVNAMGQTVFTKSAQHYGAGKQEVKINTSGLAKGVYFIQVGTKTGVVSQRFIKAD